MAPPGPVPRTAVRSMPLAAARARARGDTRALRSGAATGRGTGAGAGGGAAAGSPLAAGAGAATGAGASLGGLATGSAGEAGGGAAAGAGDGASPAPPSARIVAILAPTGTLVPGATSSVSTTPDWKHSISMMPFWVSTTAMMSPRAMRLAGLDSHFDQRAGLHVGAEGGHAKFTHRSHHPPRRRHDGCPRCGRAACFEVARVGDRHLGGAHARDGPSRS